MLLAWKVSISKTVLPLKSITWNNEKRKFRAKQKQFRKGNPVSIWRAG